MKIYVVETISDGLVQCGCSLNKKIAESMAKKYEKEWNGHSYWATEYEVNEYNFTEFEG